MQRLIEYFQKPNNARNARVAFYLLLVAVIALDLFVEKHPHFSIEKIPGFFAIYAFVACVALVGVAKLLGAVWLQREEDYYD